MEARYGRGIPGVVPGRIPVYRVEANVEKIRFFATEVFVGRGLVGLIEIPGNLADVLHRGYSSISIPSAVARHSIALPARRIRSRQNSTCRSRSSSVRFGS